MSQPAEHTPDQPTAPQPAQVQKTLDDILIMAIQDENSELAMSAIEKGADANLLVDHICIEPMRWKLQDLLPRTLEYGGDPDLIYCQAIYKNDAALQELAKEYGGGRSGALMIYNAALVKCPDIARKAIEEMNANVNAEITVRHHTGNLSIAHLIIEMDPRVERNEILEAMLNHGCNQDSRNAEGETLLLRAIKRAREEQIELLARYKADPLAADHKGEYPLKVLQKLNHSGITQHEKRKALTQIMANMQSKPKAEKYVEDFSKASTLQRNIKVPKQIEIKQTNSKKGPDIP